MTISDRVARWIRVFSAAAFFISIPFLGHSVSPDSADIYPLPYVAMFAALAVYSATEAFAASPPAGHRLRLLGFRVLFFACIAIVIVGLYQMIAQG